MSISDDALNWRVAALWSTDHRTSNETAEFTSSIMRSRTRRTLWASVATKFHWVLVRDRLYASALMLEKLPCWNCIFWVHRLKCQYFCQKFSNFFTNVVVCVNMTVVIECKIAKWLEKNWQSYDKVSRGPRFIGTRCRSLFSIPSSLLHWMKVYKKLSID